MVLPLVGSFLASSFLPAATGMSPLLAGAFGSGIGSLLQGDDFDDAIANGLFAFMGGKLLGGLSKTPVSATGGTTVEAGRIIPEGMQALGSEGLAAKTLVPSGPAPKFGSEGFFGDALKQGAATAMANPLMAAGVAGGSMLQDAMSVEPEEEDDEEPYVPTETMPFPQNPQFPTMGYRPGIDPEFNYGFYNPSAGELKTKVLNQGGMVGGSTFSGLEQDLRNAINQNTNQQIGPFVQEVQTMAQDRFGIDAGGNAMTPNFDLQRIDKIPYLEDTNFRRPVLFGPSRQNLFQRQDLSSRNQLLRNMYQPSMMGFTARLSSGGLAALAEGGDVEEAPQMPNEKDVIVNAVNAVKGNIPEDQAAIVLAQFVQTYGEEALADLVEDVRNGEYDNVGGKADGMIDGGGDGMSDSVPATIDGQEDLLVSKDEYVIDAPTVAMIGNGSSDAGAKKLDNMREEVRKAATGSRIQPKKIDAEGIMSLALAS
jgi:hypothetical protein